jgi:hypothetical protein
LLTALPRPGIWCDESCNDAASEKSSAERQTTRIIVAFVVT